MHRLIPTLTALLLALTAAAREKIIILNEGNWQSDNGRVSYFEDGRIISNSWFRDVNGKKIGDTPEDIIHVKPDLIAITVNWSNIVQFIDAGGRAVAETEDVPNCRKMATDGRYVYLTSYGHECRTVAGMKTFTKGYVAKIDAQTFKVVDAAEVGYEPDGIALYDGHLFVANTGGYSATEGDHDYERTVSVLDASTLATVRTVDTGKINLYGTMSQSGRYLCINSCGDYYSIEPATVIFDCEAALSGKADRDCCVTLPFASTCNTVTTTGEFLVAGSHFSFLTGGYEFNFASINPEQTFTSRGASGVSASLPGTLAADLQKMTSPYGIYVNPFTGYIYATDAGDNMESGALYQWNPQGQLQGKHRLYINPGHFLALSPDGEASIADITAGAGDPADAPVYDLRGIRVTAPVKGRIYIRSGKKIIWQ